MSMCFDRYWHFLAIVQPIHKKGFMSTFSQAPTKRRLQIEHLLSPQSARTDDGDDVVRGLTQTPKTLPPRYFYDDRGSQLFEQICDLPEYYPTRTEAAILEQYASEVARMTGACELVELGSGSSRKTRLLLDAYQDLGYSLRYVPIDVSAGILQESAEKLLEDYPSLQVRGLVSTYEQALAQLQPTTLPARMIFFLGSTIGNLNPQECDRFLTQITTALEPGDYFLLGIDLQKPLEILEAAYNDSQGITAAFNLNMLNHLNWRFQGNFEPNLFKHWAFFNQENSQIEMHLQCQQDCTVSLKALDLTVNFSEGETIHTEISRKFNLEKMRQYLAKQGLQPLHTWTDKNDWFALLLCQLQ